MIKVCVVQYKENKNGPTLILGGQHYMRIYIVITVGHKYQCIHNSDVSIIGSSADTCHSPRHGQWCDVKLTEKPKREKKGTNRELRKTRS